MGERLIFPAGSILLLETKQKEKLSGNLGKKVEPTLTPSLSDLATLGIDGEFMRYLSDSGLAVLANYPQVPTYESPTREFIASFETIVDVERIVGWRFRLGNITFERSRSDICSILRIQDGGIVPVSSAADRTSLMRAISPFDRFINFMSPMNLQDVTWKCLHRIIAYAINPRLDGGRYTTPKKKKSVSMTLGGGFFVTLIATSLGFDMSTAGVGQTHILSLRQMRGYKIITADGTPVFSVVLPTKALGRLRGEQPPIVRAEDDIHQEDDVPIFALPPPDIQQ